MKGYKTCSLLCILLLCFITAFIQAQAPDTTRAGRLFQQKKYKINYWVTGAISVTATVADYFAIPRIMDKIPISETELNNLNPNLLTGIDQWALHQDVSQKEFFRKGSDYFSPVAILLPCFLLKDKDIRKDWFNLLLIYYEMHAITFSTYNYSVLGPTFQNKYRPAAYYTQFTLNQRSDGNNRNSFYSGHVATTAASSYFMAKVYCDYHPELSCGQKWLAYGLASIPPLIMSYMRVACLEHFPSDCMVGLGVGLLCGVGIPELHRIKRRDLQIGYYKEAGASGLTLIWIH